VARTAAQLIRPPRSEGLPGAQPGAGKLNAAAPSGRLGHGGLAHIALFYRTGGEYLAAAIPFLTAGLSDGEPCFVAVPGPALARLRDALGPAAGQVAFADMTEMGRNPAWIIPRIQAFLAARPGRRVRYIGEPIWAGRTAAEAREAARHEALINQAFGTVPASILCPYDAAHLAGQVLAGAERSHPELQHGPAVTPSPVYCADAALPPELGLPLPPPPPDAQTFRFYRDLAWARALIGARACAAGLPPRRVSDVVLAAGELTANSVRHASGSGILRIWHDAREFICEVTDGGYIRDPLAGRLQPAPGAPGGHGLWIVHQVCDLVELRSGRDGTTIRLHMSLPCGST
jgi:anti-sigma regulatory factor (Ser/Thr protein kinase)